MIPSRASDEEWHRAGPALRALPRVMAAAVIVAAALAAARVGPSRPGAGAFLAGLGALALFAAAWVLRAGREVHARVRVETAALVVEVRGHRLRLPLEHVDALDYEAPFAARLCWLPALVLVGREGRRIRIPSMLPRGERLLDEILDAAARDDLRAWAEALRLRRRLCGAAWRIAVGYAAAAAIGVAGAVLGRI